jgi:hypothetical protein
MFQRVLAPVNPYWSYISPNTIFGQSQPSRYFHFCNYAYILSRKGAQKILQELGGYGGYHTSADHMICNRTDSLKHYMLTPLEAACYQDDDPKYAQSQFNDFSRIDNFDSDLWNNDDRFTQTEVDTCLKEWEDPRAIPVIEALQDANYTTVLPVETTPETTSADATPSSRWFTVEPHSFVPHAMFEYHWLETCFGPSIKTVHQCEPDHEPFSHHPIFIVMKPHIHLYSVVFQRYEDARKPFSVLHVSDEFCDDPVDWMNHTMLQQVFRIYPRTNVPCPEKAFTLPLGPAKQAPPNAIHQPQRDLVWSFHGTDWNYREQVLSPWKQIGPHDCKFYKDWCDPSQLGAEAYSKLCLSSIFVLCPRGNNVETFRFYEALEHGAIPIYVRYDGDDAYFSFLQANLPIISFPSWGHALAAAIGLLKNQETLFEYRKHILTRWLEWKQAIQTRCTRFLIDTDGTVSTKGAN